MNTSLALRHEGQIVHIKLDDQTLQTLPLAFYYIAGGIATAAGVLKGWPVAARMWLRLTLWFTSQRSLVANDLTMRGLIGDGRRREKELRDAIASSQAATEMMNVSVTAYRGEQDALKAEIAEQRIELDAVKRRNRSLVAFVRDLLAKLAEHQITPPDIPDDLKDTLR